MHTSQLIIMILIIITIIILIVVISIARYLIDMGEHTALYKISETYKYTHKSQKIMNKQNILRIPHTHTLNMQEHRERIAKGMREGGEGG